MSNLSNNKGRSPGVRVFRAVLVFHVGIDNVTPDQSREGWSALADQALEHIAAGVEAFRPDVPFAELDRSSSSILELAPASGGLE